MSRALLDRRLLFVTGKGGVGKSTVAIALGLLAADRGVRTVIAEIGGDDRLPRALGVRAGGSGEETQIAPSLFTISIDPQRAMEEYLRMKAGPIAPVLSRSRVFGALATATPGMRDLLTIGKVWELAQPHRRTRHAAPYDLVIVDAPATGHGIGLLRTPRTFSEIARVGPIAHQAQTIAATIADREFTGIVAVCTAEEMPVNETLALDAELALDALELDIVIVNARYPDRFAPEELAMIRAGVAHADAAGVPSARAALRAALSEQARAATAARQEERLEARFAGRLRTLPFVFSATLGRLELRELADALDDAVESESDGAPCGAPTGAPRTTRPGAGE